MVPLCEADSERVQGRDLPGVLDPLATTPTPTSAELDALRDEIAARRARIAGLLAER